MHVEEEAVCVLEGEGGKPELQTPTSHLVRCFEVCVCVGVKGDAAVIVHSKCISVWR